LSVVRGSLQLDKAAFAHREKERNYALVRDKVSDLCKSLEDGESKEKNEKLVALEKEKEVVSRQQPDFYTWWHKLVRQLNS
jgi:hypothetical protein